MISRFFFARDATTPQTPNNMPLADMPVPRSSSPSEPSSRDGVDKSAGPVARSAEGAAAHAPVKPVHHPRPPKSIGAQPAFDKELPETQQCIQFIYLTPVQSCQIHGWTSPKRTLSWDDICKNPRLTVAKCMQHGICAGSLKLLQPDVKLWIRHKGVGLADVPHMVEWPLHPVYDLRANISDLATMHYDARLMRQLGITYEFMRTLMHMDDDWMRVLHYTPAEWAEMGFTREDALHMGRRRIEWVFSGCDFDAVVMRVSSVLLPHTVFY